MGTGSKRRCIAQPKEDTMTRDTADVPESSDGLEVGYAAYAARMQSLHISRVNEMPRIELYLDQVLSIVSSELAFMYAPGERVVTGAMVNNYVKLQVVPAPVRKRYARRHLAMLLFVCAFKQVLSIEQIRVLITLAAEADIDSERAYDDMIGLFEETLRELFSEEPDKPSAQLSGKLQLVDTQGELVNGKLGNLFESAVILLAYSVHVNAMIALRESATGGRTA